MEKQYHAILLVDDDEDDLHILSSTLKQMGSSYEILQAHDGADALSQLRQLRQTGNLPSLIIMDINMPRMDGKQTLTAIKSDDSLADIPIVIFSTSSSEVDKMFFQKKNVEMITKPVEFKTFYDVAQKLLSYRKPD
jgi:CheY-like chemotaxis protein